MTVTTPALLAREFAERATGAPRQANIAVRATLASIAADAKIAAPVDTGFLRASITTEMQSPTEGEVGPEANYGIYLELGTFRMAPKPYLMPAAERHGPRFLEAMEQVAGWDGSLSSQLGVQDARTRMEQADLRRAGRDIFGEFL